MARANSTDAAVVEVACAEGKLRRLGVPTFLVLVAVHGRLGWRRWGLRFGWVDLCLLAFIGIGLVNIAFLAPNTQRMIASFYDKMIVPIAFFWLIRALAPRRREMSPAPPPLPPHRLPAPGCGCGRPIRSRP